MGNDGTLTCSVIYLRLPPLVRFASVVRVVAASLAADDNFSISALAELRTAVQNAFELVLEEAVPDDRGDADTALDVRFLVAPGRVQVEFSVASDVQPFAGALPMSHHSEGSGAVLVIENGRITLTKRATPETSGTQR